MDLLRVHGVQVVGGGVTAGASLGWDARLYVQGDFDGPAHLSPGSVLRVDGAFAGERVGRDGLLVVLGRCSLEVAQQPGTAVGAGVVLLDGAGRAWCLDDDGSLLAGGPALGGTPRVLRWSGPLDRFVDLEPVRTRAG